MKINIIFFTFTTALLLSAQPILFSQETLDCLVLNSGDTLNGNVKHIDQSGVNPKFYKKIRLADIYGKLKKHKRSDVSAFRMNNDIYEGFWLSQSSLKIIFSNHKYDIDQQNGEKYFLKAISKGKLSHYELEWWEQGESSSLWMDLLKKEEDSFFIRATQGLLGLKRKVLINYFSSCPDLKEQIQEGQLRKVREVVEFYNSNYFY
jgi:hypothetical protein